MEDENIPVHDLLGVGDQAAPGPDPLRAIVARAGRRRLRMAAGGMAVALAAGGAIGYSVSNHASNASQTATATAPATGNAAGSPPSAGQNSANASTGASFATGSAGGAALLAPYGATNLARLFTRTAGPVTIRGYQINFTVPRGVPASCQIAGPAFQAEVSTADMVGIVSGGFGTTRVAASSVTALGAQLLGVPEGDPTEVVTVATGTGVASVRMAFAGGGTDQMAPVKGWAALAAPVTGTSASQTAPLSTRVGQLTAFNASGHQVASVSVTNGFNVNSAGTVVGSSAGSVQAPEPDIACATPVCGSTPTVSAPPATVPGSTVVSPGVVAPGVPTVSTSSAASGSTASSGGATASPGLVYACAVHPTPASGSSGSGAAGSGAAGSGAAGSGAAGSASSGAATSSSG
jgi:hypothetical protein